MKSKVWMTIFLFLVLGCWRSTGASSGEDIKERMKARLPVISALKSQGIVGENNAGFLEFRGPEKKEEEIVQAENRDRKTVYRAIANQQGTTPELVGKRRALQIAEKANSGEWVQEHEGGWYQVK
jgi:uncharacterized protein YdbL (DUF1318 family)